MNYGRRGAIIYAVAIRDIRTFPDEVLERASTEVPSVGDDIRRLMDDMLETMYWGGGIGLAAPQVGMPLRVIVIDTRQNLQHPEIIRLANPVIVGRGEEEEEMEEGCLSLPDMRLKIRRPVRVEVAGLDRDGRPGKISADGLLARVLQHEIDHLDGVLIVDRLRGLKKEMLRKKLRKQSGQVLA